MSGLNGLGPNESHTPEIMLSRSPISSTCLVLTYSDNASETLSLNGSTKPASFNATSALVRKPIIALVWLSSPHIDLLFLLFGGKPGTENETSITIFQIIL